MLGLTIGSGTESARMPTPLLMVSVCFNAAAALMSALAAVEREQRLKDDADDEDDEEADKEDNGERDGEDDEEEADSSGACPDSFNLMAAFALVFADSIALFTILSL